MEFVKADAPVLQGTRVLLRPPEERDKIERLLVGRQPEFDRLIGKDSVICPPLTERDIAEWFANISEESLCWIIQFDGKCIGQVRLDPPDWDNQRTRFEVGIFDPTYWGQELGTEATRLVIAFAFERLSIHRIDARVLSYNQRAVGSLSKAGFVREGIERESLVIGNQRQTFVLLRILEGEYAESQEPGSGQRKVASNIKVDELLVALESTSLSDRVNAIQSLADMGDVRILDLLRERLNLQNRELYALIVAVGKLKRRLKVK